jgi:hypothetical protein
VELALMALSLTMHMQASLPGFPFYIEEVKKRRRKWGVTETMNGISLSYCYVRNELSHFLVHVIALSLSVMSLAAEVTTRTV